MVTVLLAAYEGEKYLREQLDSVLGQTVKDLKILVSDDGSRDATPEILAEYAKQYPERVFLKSRNEADRESDRKNGFPPGAGNFFWLLSQAEDGYVMLCDQDDVWKREKAEKLLSRVKMLEARYGESYPVLVHSDMVVADQNLEEISPSFFAYQKCDPKRTRFSETLAENPATGGAVMMNAALLSFLREKPDFCVMHDWWISLTAACFGVISCVREPLSYYRQHGDNTLGAKKTGSVGDLTERAGRGDEVRKNYEGIFAQARAFYARYGRMMSREKRETLLAFLALPGEKKAKRAAMVWKYGFFKSSALQTFAQCVTIPKSAGEALPPPDTGSRAGEGGFRKESPRPFGQPAKVDCVILNYNDWETVARLVREIHDYPSLQRIILVDNCSTDDSAAHLKALADTKVVCLRAEKNGGYGSGNNIGVRWAVERDGADHVLIANPDVSFSDSCVRSLSRLLETSPRAAAAAAKMEDPAYGSGNNGWRLHGFFGELLSMGPVSRRLFRRFLTYPKSKFAGKRAVWVGAVHGSMLMVDGRKFLEAGGYDEGIFLYQEEAVLGRLLAACGYGTAFLLTESYRHEHSASVSKSLHALADRQRLRNESVMYYFKKYLKINRPKELFARAWFAGILLEIRIAEAFGR